MCYIVAKKDIILIHPDQTLCQFDIGPYLCTVNYYKKLFPIKTIKPTNCIRALVFFIL